MTAVSSSSVATVSNVVGCCAIAAPMVSVPSIGDSAAGSAVITKKSVAAVGLLEPGVPLLAIGRSGVPWKQK